MRIWPILVLALLCGCERPAATADQTSAAAGRLRDAGRVLHRGNGPEPGTLDPQRAAGTPEYSILRDLYEGLLGEAPDASLVPGVAERWQIDDGGRRYTFDLREDACWSDGTALTAVDFVGALRRAVDPATASPNAYLLGAIVGAAEIGAGRAPPSSLAVSATTAHRLVIELSRPNGHFLAVLSHPVSFPYRADAGVSNGPYRLAERVSHDYVRLERNPCYWDRAAVDIDGVYFHAIADTATEVNLYRAGQLDLTSEIPNSAYAFLRKQLGAELVTAPYLSTYAYLVNVAQPPFAGAPALRRALSLAIDREQLVERVTGVGERAAYHWVPPGTAGYTPQRYAWSDWSAERRLAEARRLFEQAREDRADIGAIELRYDASPNHRRNAEALAAMWRQSLGVEIVLREQEWKVFLDERQDRSRGGLTRLGWVGDYNDPAAFLEVFAADHPQNVSGFADPDYDALLEAAAAETDAAARRRLLEQAERRLLASDVLIPLYFNVSKHLVKPYVEGFVPNVMNHHQTKHLRLRADASAR